jgi:hypothetical protein
MVHYVGLKWFNLWNSSTRMLCVHIIRISCYEANTNTQDDDSNMGLKLDIHLIEISLMYCSFTNLIFACFFVPIRTDYWKWCIFFFGCWHMHKISWCSFNELHVCQFLLTFIYMYGVSWIRSFQGGVWKRTP